MWEHDPRLDPKPDYGSLGPGDSNGPITVPERGLQAPWAVLTGVLAALALVCINSGVARNGWQQLAHYLPLQGKADARSRTQAQTASSAQKGEQQQAELLLQRAINHSEGANEQIASEVNGWRGHLNLSPHLNSLVATGLNSNDLQVRAATIEVDLAALNIEKTTESLDRLEKEAQSGTQQQRVWAVWTLGLMGNRGVEPERVNGILNSALHESNAEIRQWAVEGLSYLATDDALQTLLKVMHDDPSGTVRERAACGVAQSGMFTDEQRHRAVPKLIDFAQDTTLDAPTHSWVYHALRDITAQNLPDNSAAWQNWYQSTAR